MIKGATATGFKFEVPKDILQDAEFLEELYAVQGGDSSRFYAMINILLGKDQKARLWKHIKDKTGKGRVMQPDVESEITDIFFAINEDREGKNS